MQSRDCLIPNLLKLIIIQLYWAYGWQVSPYHYKLLTADAGAKIIFQIFDRICIINCHEVVANIVDKIVIITITGNPGISISTV